MDESWHGTVGGYTNHGCRCDDCKAAKSAENRAYAARNQQRLIEYHRNYRRDNPETVAETQRKSRKKRKNEIAEYNHNYYAEHRNAIVEQQRLYRQRNQKPAE